MNRRPALTVILALAVTAVLPAGAVAGPPADDTYIVVLKPGADSAKVARAHRDRHGAAVKYVFRRALNGYAARIADGRLDALRADPRVAYVERDREIRASGTVMQTSAVWGLDRVDQAALPLSGTYNYPGTGAGVTAYVIDTGIRASHQDFGGRVAPGYSVVADGVGTGDCNGHGTHVAGTLGGTVYGVAKGVTLVPVRVLDCEGSGTTSGVIAGVDWVTGRTARPAVANMSLGGDPSRSLDAAVQRSIDSGVTYSVAAGNEGADACGTSPGRLPAAITVAATDRSDEKPSWSNYGDCVDWFAPGSGITSAYATSDSATATISGTSMAAPHTAGAAALAAEALPGASPAQVREALAAALTLGVVTTSASTNNALLRVAATETPSTPVNLAPSAVFSSTCSNLACTFDASLSSDSDGTVRGYAWSFGDGAVATGATPSHTYATGGTYDVALTVIDDDGAESTTTQSVTVIASAAALSPTAPSPVTEPTLVPVELASGEPVAPSPPVAPTLVPRTRSAVRLNLSPTDYRVLAGNVHRRRGALSRLFRSDGLRLELFGRRGPQRTRSEFSTTAQAGPSQRSALRQLELQVDVAVSSTRAVVGLRIFNWSRNRYETTATSRTAGTGKLALRWATTADPRAYVSPSGKIRIAVRATHTGALQMWTDRVRVTLVS